MHNVVNKLTKKLLLTTCFLSTGALTQDHNSGGGVGGNYTCNNGCDPRYQSDQATQTFIRTVVNQDVGTWRVGDKVNIYNPDGYGAIYGRAHAFSTVFYRYGPTPDSVGGSSNSGGNGGGGESGNGGNSGGSTWDPGLGGGSGGGGGCPGGVTMVGNTIICHQN